jgi:parallel beta-helix repeat protein
VAFVLGRLSRVAALAVPLLVLGVFVPQVASAVSARTLYASPSASATGSGRSCASAQYATINAAVAAAADGGTVVACRGTYTEDVVIQKALTLIGQSATINATGLAGAPIGAVLGQQLFNGITIEASHVTVQGFTVTGAQGEGILAINPNPVAGPDIGGMQLFTGAPITQVMIRNNTVVKNDLGFNDPSSPYMFCTPNAGSDCGEGIHLLSVANSTVMNNKSDDNSGGILLTDEFGPNHDNLIQGNEVKDNTRDCGITIPSHNLGLDPATGQPDPSFGGVYRNRVIGNTVTGNGVEGFGAGVGVFAPFPFSASYDNVVSGNFIQGNGLAGISVHSHAPNAFVDGNVFTSNVIGKNNVDFADGADVSPLDKQTTGILIWSAASTYHFTVAGNIIFNNTYGIWLTPSTIQASGLGTNHFANVQTPVFNAS